MDSRTSLPPTPRTTAWLRRDGLILLGLTLLGAVLRLVALNQVPPGLHYDEAVYGLQALDIYHGQFPIYFSSYTGREPLYMYFIAAMFRLVGVGALGIRLTSAVIGIATIPLVYLLLRSLHSRRVGLLAATWVAVSYWHLTVSRNGYPNILIPPIECLSLYGLWRGYRDGKAAWFAFGGVFLGLVLYTYLAARFVPITVALFFLYALIADWRRWRKRFWGLALAALVTVAVFAPLGLYFLQHPQDFFERANQVLIFRRAEPGQAIMLVLRNLGESLRGIVFRGDLRNHFNLPGKAMLSVPSAVLFFIGLARAARRWHQPEYGLLPIWVLGMTLPAILTVAEMPQGQRMFGIVPALGGLVALGLDTVLTRIARRWPRAKGALVGGLLGLLLAFEGISTAYTYFAVWGRASATYYSFHGDYVALAKQAVAELDQGHLPVILSREYKHPGVVLTDFRTLDACWLSGSNTLAVPAAPLDGVRYLWPVHSLQLNSAISETLASLTETVDELPGPNGEVAVRVARLKPDVQPAEQSQPAVANFAGEVEVLDWDMPESQYRDKALRVLVHWRVRQKGEGRVLALHLQDESGVRWAQSRDMGFFADYWHTGDTAYQMFSLDLPPGIPAGRYAALLVFAREDDRLLPVTRDGRLSGIGLSLGEVALEADGAFVQPPAEGGTEFAPGLQAIDHESLDMDVAPGARLQAEVTWQVTAPINGDYQVSLDLAPQDGVAAASFRLPLAYQQPTSTWQPGEVVRAIYALTLRGLPAGIYHLRLSLADVADGPTLDLGTVRISGQEKLFDVPAMQHSLRAELSTAGQDAEIELLGYDLTPESPVPGQPCELALYWRALAAPQGDEKVFVHLTDSTGQMLAQSDAVPANWTRPTLGWEAGEIVADVHVLSLPEGADLAGARLYAGLYDATTLERLAVRQDGQVVSESRVLLGTLN